MTKKSIVASLFLLACSSFLSGCIIDNSGECYEVCDTTCQVRCNPWECWEECWDECWDECSYVEYEDVYVDDGPRAECAVDADCGRDESCNRGACEVTGGDAGLCQSCDRNSDCSEEGARCLQINGTENICGRACDATADCPRGFECLEVSREVNIPHQCVPVADAESGERSCEMAEEPEPLACRLNSDCAQDEICEGGACVPASSPECREDRDCAQGEVCQAEACVAVEPEPEPSCAEGAACGEGLICVDGECLAPEPEPACEDDAACGAEMICEEGLCVALECRRSADCAEAEICVNARCEQGCGDDSACPEGLSCLAPGYCAELVPDCAVDSDCPEGKACEAGFCVAL